MAEIANKEYNELMTRLSLMAGGIQQHAGNPKISNTLSEQSYLEAKAKVEQMRKEYLEAEKITRQKYDAFNLSLQQADYMLSGDVRIIKGVFGRTSEELRSFGITPEKSTRTRKPNGEETSPEPTKM